VRILHITPFYKPDVGGMETFTSHLVPELQRRGHENLVLTSRRIDAPGGPAEVDGVPVHRLDYIVPLYNKDAGGILRAKKAAERIKQEFQPDVIVVNLGGPMAFLYLSTENTAPAPLVVIAHDLSAPGISVPTLRQLFGLASHVTAVSAARLRDAQRIAPEAASRMSIVHPCLPRREFLPGVARSATPLALMTGRLDAVKGFDLAIEAFGRVHRELPHARLVLVGDGPGFQELHSQINQLGLDGVVHLAGYLPDSQLTRLYQEAWVSLVPSRHSESFGLVALEAMQAACPVIASDTGGLGEVVLDGETGILFPKEDVQQLAASILDLFRNHELRIRMGEAGRRRAEGHFAWERCVAAYESILHRVARQ